MKKIQKFKIISQISNDVEKKIKFFLTILEKKKNIFKKKKFKKIFEK